jgi:hypothetical protein
MECNEKLGAVADDAGLHYVQLRVGKKWCHGFTLDQFFVLN